MTTTDDEPAVRPLGEGGLVVLCRLRIDVAYDGSGFCGWARQPGLRSVQAELEAALRVVLRVQAEVSVRVAVAGRTDAGVHATGQVCHADVPAAAVGDLPQGSGDAVVRRLNGVLPRDIRVRRVSTAPSGFDARWSARWRHYEYVVADNPAAQDPRTRGHVLWHPRALDVPAMASATEGFLGEHDFAAFCRARPGASSVRTILAIGWARDPGGPGVPGAGRRPEPGAAGPASGEIGEPGPGLARFMVRADAFCHSMVRTLVGAFLAVGEGRWPVERPAQLLRAERRVPSIVTAPAHGLTLVEVGYPEHGEMAAQAQRARRWRGRDDA